MVDETCCLLAAVLTAIWGVGGSIDCNMGGVGGCIDCNMGGVGGSIDCSMGGRRGTDLGGLEIY
jgi:hypothetical protein